jgi:hypothetical protein
MQKILKVVVNKRVFSTARDDILNKLSTNTATVLANINISKPPHFNRNFQIPKPIKELDLHIKNSHDNDIAFNDNINDNNKLDNNENDQPIKSVTDVVAKYFNQFDPVSALDKMMSGILFFSINY